MVVIDLLIPIFNPINAKTLFEISILDFILALGAFTIIVLGFVLSFLLFTKDEGRKIAQKLLSILLVIAAMVLLHNLILLINLPTFFNSLYFLPLDYTLSIPPLLYFYFKFKIRPRTTF